MIRIDLGNSSCKIYDKQVVKIATDEIFQYLDQTQQPIIMCSVVPRLHQRIGEYSNVKLITNSDYHLMFDDPEKELQTKGADRIIASYSAVCKYQPKVIVVDIGTCVTIDVVDNRKYISGLIYPGFEMLETVATDKISQLPAPVCSDSLIDTASQLYWANIYGFIGAVKNLIASQFDRSYQVVVTGGTISLLKEQYNTDLISELIEFDPIYDANLIADGLDFLSRKI